MRATRILLGNLVSLFVSLVIIYLLVRVALGNPLAGLGAEGAVEGPAAAAVLESMGLDKPLLQGLLEYLESIPTLSTGTSLVYSADASTLVASRLPYTLVPVLAGSLVGLAVYAAAFVAAGDTALRVLEPLAYVPGFILAVPFVLTSWSLGFPEPLPSTSIGKMLVYVLLAGLVTASRLAHVYPPPSRLERYAALGVHVTLERLRALRLVSAPAVVYWGVLAARLIERSVFIEPLLAYNGLGALALTAVLNADIPVALAALTSMALVSYAILTAVECIAARLDPRVG